MTRLEWTGDDDPRDGQGAISWTVVLVALAFGALAVLFR
jgi:hypothetical protein